MWVFIPKSEFRDSTELIEVNPQSLSTRQLIVL